MALATPVKFANSRLSSSVIRYREQRAYGEVTELLLHGTKVTGKRQKIESHIEQPCNRFATVTLSMVLYVNIL